jgi:hypothetical protein
MYKFVEEKLFQINYKFLSQLQLKSLYTCIRTKLTYYSREEKKDKC